MPNVFINKLYYCLAQSAFSISFEGILKELDFWTVCYNKHHNKNDCLFPFWLPSSMTFGAKLFLSVENTALPRFLIINPQTTEASEKVVLLDLSKIWLQPSIPGGFALIPIAVISNLFQVLSTQALPA